jgi:hypothetical protein
MIIARVPPPVDRRLGGPIEIGRRSIPELLA